MRKFTFWYMRLTTTQTSPRIRAVWTEYSMSAWRNFASLAIQNAPSEEYGQTARAVLNRRCVHMSETTSSDVAANKPNYHLLGSLVIRHHSWLIFEVRWDWSVVKGRMAVFLSALRTCRRPWNIKSNTELRETWCIWYNSRHLTFMASCVLSEHQK